MVGELDRVVGGLNAFVGELDSFRRGYSSRFGGL
jgi:hypothetical protein